MPNPQGWLIWHEDIEGPGTRVAFQNKKDADEAIAGQLDYIIKGVEREVAAAKAAGNMDEFHQTLEELAQGVRQYLAAGEVTEAVTYWHDFEEEDVAVMESFGTVRVERIDIV